MEKQENRSLAEYVFGKRKVRVVEIDGNPWFVAMDVCKVLDLGNITEALRNHPENEVDDFSNTEVVSAPDSIGRKNPRLKIINEPGLYRLVFQSRKPEAEAFKTWVFWEVLPAIRRQGYYALEKRVLDLRRQCEEIEKSWRELNCEKGKLEEQLEDPVQTAKRELRRYIVQHYAADENPNRYEDADYCYHCYESSVEHCLSIDSFLAEVCAIVPDIRVKKRKGRHWAFLGLARNS
jgi:prophage antirepressor-like protein